MADGRDPITIDIVENLSALDATAWDACAGHDSPFVSHAFLSILEECGCVGADTGWHPVHLTLRDSQERLMGCTPLYLKSHSYGEYVFDHGWADAYERAGGQYYPKLQGGVPFTPVGGPRLLVHPDAPKHTADHLIQAQIGLGRQLGASSVHIPFTPQDTWELYATHGFLQRTGIQFHWYNHGYASFDDFLDALSSRKRKAIRKERRQVAESGVKLHRLSGDDLKESHWDAFFRFYQDTSNRKWGQAYLNRDFFSMLGERLNDRVVLVMGEMDGDWVCGALNLLGNSAIYGRNWGATLKIPGLHFEACYYQAIEHAIEHKLERVEAGAQGEHKIARGYLPVTTYSAHWIADPGFKTAIAQYLENEGRAMEHEKAVLAEDSPYRQA